MPNSETHHTHRHGGWFNYIRPRRFQFLIGFQLAFIAIVPLLGQEMPARAIAAVLSSLAFIQTCVCIVNRKRVLFLSGTVAFALSIFGSIVLTVDAAPFNHQAYQAGSHILAIVFYLFAASIIFRDVIKEGDVDLNKLCGSICLYILIGIIFGQFYQLAEVLEPGSFFLDMAKLEKHWPISRFENANLLNYFSYVTLSTLGYGDISPITRLTRTLAWSEALLGQIYLAILVSRLVGLHIANATNVNNLDD